MLSRPPVGMASRAFTARFKSTCSSWPGSAFTDPASGASVTESSMSSPSSRRSIFCMWATTALRPSTLGASTCRRLNARSWRVSSAARTPAFLISTASSWRGSSGGVAWSNNCVDPRIAVSRLLKSWAIPPASCPTASIFWDWRSCSSSVRWAVTSRASTRRARRPANSMGRATRYTSSTRPSLVMPDPRPLGTLVGAGLQLLFQPDLVLRGADVANGEGQELLLRVPVAHDRRLVDRQDAQCLEVVDEHRLGARLELQTVPGLGGHALLLRALALDRHGDLGGHELQDLLLGLAVADAGGVGLGHEHADGTIADPEGHAQPVDGRRPDELHLAPPLQLGVHLGRDQRRLAGAQHVFGEALAELLGRKVGVVFVDEVREAEHAAGGVVQRDVEVLGRHQLADDAVDRPEQLLQVPRRLRRLRDAKGGELDLVGAPALGDVAEAPHAAHALAADALGLGVALEDPAVLEGEDVEARRDRKSVV